MLLVVQNCFCIWFYILFFQLSAKLASVIPEQELAETLATTAESRAYFTVKHSVTLESDIDTDLAKLQDNAIAVAPVGSNIICSLFSKTKTYTKRQLKAEIELSACKEDGGNVGRLGSW